MIQIIKRSVLVLAVRLGLLLFLIDTVYALFILAYLRFAPPSDYNYTFIIVIWVLHTVKFLLLMILMLDVLLKWLGESYIIHDKQLTVSSGVIAVSDKVYDLNTIKKIHIYQDWMGRLLHYGVISLQLSDSSESQTVDLTDIHNPREYEHILVVEFMQ